MEFRVSISSFDFEFDFQFRFPVSSFFAFEKIYGIVSRGYHGMRGKGMHFQEISRDHALIGYVLENPILSDDRSNEAENSETEFPDPGSRAIYERISQQFEPKYFRAELLKLEPGTVIKRQRSTIFDDSDSEPDIKNEPTDFDFPVLKRG